MKQTIKDFLEIGKSYVGYIFWDGSDNDFIAIQIKPRLLRSYEDVLAFIEYTKTCFSDSKGELYGIEKVISVYVKEHKRVDNVAQTLVIEGDSTIYAHITEIIC